VRFKTNYRHIYMDLEAGGSYFGLEGFQGGRDNQGGWELVPDVDGSWEEWFPQCLGPAVWLDVPHAVASCRGVLRMKKG